MGISVSDYISIIVDPYQISPSILSLSIHYFTDLQEHTIVDDRYGCCP